MGERVNPALGGLLVPLGDLHEDPANVRLHGPRNMDAIRASLAEFGQQKPIVVGASGKVIAGNATIRAAAELGWERVAAVRFNGEGAVPEAAYAIADNRTAELAEWDEEALGLALEALAEEGIDLEEVLAFDEREVRAALAAAEAPDEFPDVDEGTDVTCPKCGYEWKLWRS